VILFVLSAKLHISETTLLGLVSFLLVVCGCRLCDMLCTSSFLNVIMFSY